MFTRGSPGRPAAIDAYASQSGREPAIIASYRYWSDRAIVIEDLSAVEDRGAVRWFTWEPWRADGTGYSLRRIARGDYDPMCADPLAPRRDGGARSCSGSRTR